MSPLTVELVSELFHLRQSGFHTGFSVWGGGDVVCGLTGMGEYFSQVTPEMVLKALWFHFADK